jgi:hypothetical protein
LALAWALEQIVPRADALGTIDDELRRVTIENGVTVRGRGTVGNYHVIGGATGHLGRPLLQPQQLPKLGQRRDRNDAGGAEIGVRGVEQRDVVGKGRVGGEDLRHDGFESPARG